MQGSTSLRTTESYSCFLHKPAGADMLVPIQVRCPAGPSTAVSSAEPALEIAVPEQAPAAPMTCSPLSRVDTSTKGSARFSSFRPSSS